MTFVVGPSLLRLCQLYMTPCSLQAASLRDSSLPTLAAWDLVVSSWILCAPQLETPPMSISLSRGPYLPLSHSALRPASLWRRSSLQLDDLSRYPRVVRRSIQLYLRILTVDPSGLRIPSLRSMQCRHLSRLVVPPAAVVLRPCPPGPAHVQVHRQTLPHPEPREG
ncbi:hypothetical protein C8Q79DRAFT_309380 [Trametes meyenii]|nr:hypothetical protein C8Q79DRAFT_309380 [Trametes meyenii]